MKRFGFKGFSLVESMVVMAIVSIAVLVVPAMLLWLRMQGVSHAAAQIQADIQLARVMAIRRKQCCTLRFNAPRINQYTNNGNGARTDLRAYRGNVHFLAHGPDGAKMAGELSFNSRGMSRTVAPVDVFISDGQGMSTYRLRVLQPGGVTVQRWRKDKKEWG